MLALSDASTITVTVTSFFLLLALLIFLRLLLRKGPPHWVQFRVGFYIERVPDDIPPPTTYRKPE
jgi:hypothetical protein